MNVSVRIMIAGFGLTVVGYLLGALHRISWNHAVILAIAGGVITYGSIAAAALNKYRHRRGL